MPRIRKKTSNRLKSNDRAKLKKKIHDSKKKKGKLAKKNVQWKSKTPKDPGIPSEFPYKDQILAEVAEQRRLAAEEKQKKKEEKQKALARARAIARGEPVSDEDQGSQEQGSDAEEGGVEEEDEETGKRKSKKDLNVGAESIASLSAKLIDTQLKPRPRPAAETVEEEEEEEMVPVLINRDLPNLKSVLDKADVILEVLDGRDPLAFRSKNVEELVRETGKKALLVVNKIDGCPREALAAWAGHLRTQQPTLLFRSATSFLPEGPPQSQPQVKKGKGKAKAPANDAVGADSILSCLAQWAKEKSGEEPLTVAVVGVTNVGKSSFINSLLKRAALPVYTLASSSRGPTTTELPQEVTLEVEERKITLIDTPGLSFISEEDDNESILQECRARDILLRSKGRIDRLKDPNPPIAQIVSRANAEDLMLLYSLPAFAKGDSTAFLSGVARANQLVKKKGELDLTGAARIVLRDWSVGKFSRFTTPPTTSTPAESSSNVQLTAADPGTLLAQLYAKDEAILATLPTRKELRKKGGLVKFSSGVIDVRKASVEADWAGLEDSEDEESDDDESEGGDVVGMDVDIEEEDEEDEAEEEDNQEEEINESEDEEEVAPIPLSNKQKRKRGLEKPAPERPAKKVSFAPPKRAGASGKGKHEPIKAAQQKPLKPVQAAEKKLASISKDKSASASASIPKAVSKSKSAVNKAATVAGSTKAVSENKGKVANVKPKTKASPASNAKKDGKEQEVYDFGKFF